jgi:hypothetical protein
VLHPTVNCGVIDMQTPLEHHLLFAYFFYDDRIVIPRLPGAFVVACSIGVPLTMLIFCTMDSYMSNYKEHVIDEIDGVLLPGLVSAPAESRR